MKKAGGGLQGRRRNGKERADFMTSAWDKIDRKNSRFGDNLDAVSGKTFAMIMDLREKDYRRIFQALSSLMAVREMTVEGLTRAAVPVEADTAEQAAEECLAEAAKRAAQTAVEKYGESGGREEAKRRLHLLALAAPLADLKKEFDRLG